MRNSDVLPQSDAPTTGPLITSFRSPQDVGDTGWWTVLSHPFSFTQYTLANSRTVIGQEGMGRPFLNSPAISIPGTLVPVLIAAFVAFAFAWMKFPGRNVLLVVVVALLVIPLQMTFIPVLIIYAKLSRPERNSGRGHGSGRNPSPDKGFQDGLSCRA